MLRDLHSAVYCLPFALDLETISYTYTTSSKLFRQTQSVCFYLQEKWYCICIVQIKLYYFKNTVFHYVPNTFIGYKIKMLLVSKRFEDVFWLNIVLQSRRSSIILGLSLVSKLQYCMFFYQCRQKIITLCRLFKLHLTVYLVFNMYNKLDAVLFNKLLPLTFS